MMIVEISPEDTVALQSTLEGLWHAPVYAGRISESYRYFVEMKKGQEEIKLWRYDNSDPVFTELDINFSILLRRVLKREKSQMTWGEP